MKKWDNLLNNAAQSHKTSAQKRIVSSEFVLPFYKKGCIYKIPLLDAILIIANYN
jgi:hypothetical protein